MSAISYNLHTRKQTHKHKHIHDRQIDSHGQWCHYIAILSWGQRYCGKKKSGHDFFSSKIAWWMMAHLSIHVHLCVHVSPIVSPHTTMSWLQNESEPSQNTVKTQLKGYEQSVLMWGFHTISYSQHLASWPEYGECTKTFTILGDCGDNFENYTD